MFFIKIVCIMVFNTDCQSAMVFLYILLVCDGFFIHIVSFKVIFSMKGVMRVFSDLLV